MSTLDISEVAQRTGVPASTLRHYEDMGLIRSIGRRGLRRLFDGGVLERLALIAVGRAAGFSLEEIARVFTPEGPHIDRQMLAAKADELDATIRRLTAMRNGLRHAAECKAPSHMECPTFRRIVRAAAAGMGEVPDVGAPIVRARPKRSVPQRSTPTLRRARRGRREM